MLIILCYLILNTPKNTILKAVVEQKGGSPNTDIKCGTSSVKTYMDYKMITSKSSRQYQYIQKYIKIKDGYLYDGEYLGVALSSYYGDIGSKFIITLDTGIVLKVVKIDEKADQHTNGCSQKWDGSMLEIVIDSYTMKVEKSSNGYYYNGNFNNNPMFKGKIESIKVEK